MMPALLAIVLVLVVLALLPYTRSSSPIIDEDDTEEAPKLRYKTTRQR
jgi:hypothetical protein